MVQRSFLMSALSYICGYGFGSSDESDGELERLNAHRSKLPAPDLSKVAVVPSDVHEEDPGLHEGRSRSFPHERGNWATFAYISYPKEENLLTVIEKLHAAVSSLTDCHICDDFHISLSKTVVLKYHQIASFSSSLQASVATFDSFDLTFDTVKIYCNEEKSRTFISLQVDQLSNDYLTGITEKIDEILEDFKLPIFYEDPSFHMSILWVNGNKQKELTEIIDTLDNIVTQEIKNNPLTVTINSVNCKSGNKLFQYSLQ